MIAQTVLALATHGLSYTPAQVRAMTRRDRDALLAQAHARVVEAEQERMVAEMQRRVAARGR